jgi:hypothetical protein
MASHLKFHIILNTWPFHFQFWSAFKVNSFSCLKLHNLFAKSVCSKDLNIEGHYICSDSRNALSSLVHSHKDSGSMGRGMGSRNKIRFSWEIFIRRERKRPHIFGTGSVFPGRGTVPSTPNLVTMVWSPILEKERKNRNHKWSTQES